MRVLTLLAAVAAGALAVGACGGGGGDSNGPSGSSGFSARIDGQIWVAEPIGVTAQAVPGVPGSFLVVGTQTSGGVTTSLVITMYNISGPGTYPFGVSSDVFGGTGQ